MRRDLGILCFNIYFSTNTTIGRNTAAHIDPRDTYLVMEKTSPHIPMQIRVAIGASPRIIPAAVKTPFPPLKPAKIVHI